MDIESYLESKGIGYEELSEPERRAISNFAVIWTLFEAKLLDENASALKIHEKAKEWIDNYGTDEHFIDTHLDYFRNRYVDGVELNYRYGRLYLRKNDLAPLVTGVLLKQIDDPISKLTSCLIIILRYRNNYFHGIKWAYQFRDQQDNFETASSILTWCIDRYDH